MPYSLRHAATMARELTNLDGLSDKRIMRWMITRNTHLMKNEKCVWSIPFAALQVDDVDNVKAALDDWAAEMLLQSATMETPINQEGN